MAAKKTKPKTSPPKRMGRPPKSAEAVADRVVAVRFTESSDNELRAVLESVRAEQVERGRSPDDVRRYSAAHLLRDLVHQEAQRRGLGAKGDE